MSTSFLETRMLIRTLIVICISVLTLGGCKMKAFDYVDAADAKLSAWTHHNPHSAERFEVHHNERRTQQLDLDFFLESGGPNRSQFRANKRNELANRGW